MEIIELEEHPWFVASQFHPEFKSKPDKAHPLFREFIHHALIYQNRNGTVILPQVSKEEAASADPVEMASGKED